MTFWSDYSPGNSLKGEGGFEPKRSFTFILSLVGTDNKIDSYLIKKVKKPGYEISESEHKFLNHSFYYPGKMKWTDVSFTIVDVISPNGSQVLMKILEDSGYQAPKIPINLNAGGAASNAQTVSKLNAIKALGVPRIKQINHNGDVVEEWVLQGAWVKSATFGELAYDAEELLNIEVALKYDYAYLDVIGPKPSTSPTNAKGGSGKGTPSFGNNGPA